MQKYEFERKSVIVQFGVHFPLQKHMVLSAVRGLSKGTRRCDH